MKMAERPTTTMTTTSSQTMMMKIKDGKQLKSALTKPKVSELQIVNDLAKSLNESYQNVKKKQQLYKEISSGEHLKNAKKRKVLNTVLENKENKENEPNTSNEECDVNEENDDNDENDHDKDLAKENLTEWQEVIYNKNKLKRKKKMSASLTSVSDSVNQEKRTRIEGIQLNCRGRLQIKENPKGSIEVQTGPSSQRTPMQSSSLKNVETEKVTAKPPIPPNTQNRLSMNPNQTPLVPPPRLKRKLIENVQTIQKLNNLTEQLRLEISELKSSLTTERGAVRVLRAQNECESRKWKNEVKKLQQQIDLMRKGVLANAKKANESSSNGMSDSTLLSSANGLINYEIQRLTNELQILKDANKTLEEKNLINYDADRRKAADIRELRDSYEIRLTQLQKSAKNEISRLLEEIKTKERNIGQLKKDLQLLQNQQTCINGKVPNKRGPPPSPVITKNVKPSTTNDLTKQIQTNCLKQTNKKPKKNPTNPITSTNTSTSTNSNNSNLNVDNLKDSTPLQNSDEPERIAEGANKVEDIPVKDSKDDQTTNEITQLRDIELMKNTKNIKTNTNGIKLLTLTQQNNNNLENNGNHKNLLNNNGLLTTTTATITATATPTTITTSTSPTSTTNTSTNDSSITTTSGKIITKSTCGTCQREYHSMPPELNEEFLTNQTAGPKSNESMLVEKQTHTNDCTDLPIYRSKDNNSDSDSALSSAPPSISPQPPANGLEPNDIWQTIRSYTQDTERLQKEVDLLQKENERLQKELNLAKEQIIESERNAIEATKQNNVQEFLERIRFLEEKEHNLENECSELKEQNELLEFRILELEETNDKWSLQSHVPPTTPSSTNHNNSNSSSHTNVNDATKDFWSNSCSSSNGSNSSNSSNSTTNSNSSCNKSKLDPMQLLFSSRNNNGNTMSTSDSGITSPHSQLHAEDDFHLLDITNEELCRRLSIMMKKTSSLDDEDKQYLQQVIALVQQFDLLSQRTSGPTSLNTSCSSSDEPSSLEIAKSRISDYSSASSTSSSSATSATCNTQNTFNSCDNSNKTSNNAFEIVKSSSSSVGSGSVSASVCGSEIESRPSLTSTSISPSAPKTSLLDSAVVNGISGAEVLKGNPVSSAVSVTTTTSRIVATVQPYNSSSSNHQQQSSFIVPTNTPNDSPRRVRSAAWQCNSLSESGVFVEDSDYLENSHTLSEQSISTQTDFQENEDDEDDFTFVKPFQQKLQRYHSSPLTRHSHQSSSPYLNDQKHLQFYKDRLESLESKVRIYESSGDIQAKLLADRLQKEIQLEKQVKELQERVECLESENLNLEEEKCEFEEAENDTRLRLQRLEIELEILSQRNIELELSKEALSAKYKDCRSECMTLREDLEACERQVQLIDEEKKRNKKNLELLHSLIPIYCFDTLVKAYKLSQTKENLPKELEELQDMGNVPSNTNLTGASMVMKSPMKEVSSPNHQLYSSTGVCSQCGQDSHQIHLLKEENIALRLQINDMKSHHFAALETADNQWVDLEKSYKEREEHFKSNEQSLKQKISKLQECMREDSQAAHEKISQLEESEESLKLCLVRLSKEHRELFEKYKVLCDDIERLREENETLTLEAKPTQEAYENEKRHAKELQDEINFMRRLQKETEVRVKLDEDALRVELAEAKKQSLHVEVTNSELKEEVATLEDELFKKSKLLTESQDKIRELYDEIRSKEDLIEKMEFYHKNNYRSSAFSLAHELKDRLKTESKLSKTNEEEVSKAKSDVSEKSLRSSPSRDHSLETTRSIDSRSPRVTKRVSIDDLEHEVDVGRSQSSSPSRSGLKKHINFSPIVKKTSLMASNASLSEDMTNETTSVKDMEEFVSADTGEFIEEVIIKEENVKDLHTAKLALDGAIKNFERHSSEVPKLILTDITRI